MGRMGRSLLPGRAQLRIGGQKGVKGVQPAGRRGGLLLVQGEGLGAGRLQPHRGGQSQLKSPGPSPWGQTVTLLTL